MSAVWTHKNMFSIFTTSNKNKVKVNFHTPSTAQSSALPVLTRTSSDHRNFTMIISMWISFSISWGHSHPTWPHGLQKLLLLKHMSLLCREAMQRYVPWSRVTQITNDPTRRCNAIYCWYWYRLMQNNWSVVLRNTCKWSILNDI